MFLTYSDQKILAIQKLLEKYCEKSGKSRGKSKKYNLNYENFSKAISINLQTKLIYYVIKKKNYHSEFLPEECNHQITAYKF